MKNKENKLDNNNFALGELPNESKTKLGEKKILYHYRTTSKANWDLVGNENQEFLIII